MCLHQQSASSYPKCPQQLGLAQAQTEPPILEARTQLPPPFAFQKKLDSGIELQLEPKFSDTDNGKPKLFLNHCANMAAPEGIFN